MARVIWSPEALSRLDEINTYIARYDVNAAARVVERLFDAADSLWNFPARGRLAANGARELVTVPPYVIRYDHLGDTVRILGIRHGRQRG